VLRAGMQAGLEHTFEHCQAGRPAGTHLCALAGRLAGWQAGRQRVIRDRQAGMPCQVYTFGQWQAGRQAGRQAGLVQAGRPAGTHLCATVIRR
jgi:hypothetical protein